MKLFGRALIQATVIYIIVVLAGSFLELIWASVYRHEEVRYEGYVLMTEIFVVFTFSLLPLTVIPLLFLMEHRLPLILNLLMNLIWALLMILLFVNFIFPVFYGFHVRDNDFEHFIIPPYALVYFIALVAFSTMKSKKMKKDEAVSSRH